MKRVIQTALAILMIISAMSLVFVGCGGGGGPTGNETIKIKVGRTYPLMPGYWGAPAANDSAFKWEDSLDYSRLPAGMDTTGACLLPPAGYGQLGDELAGSLAGL